MGQHGFGYDNKTSGLKTLVKYLILAYSNFVSQKIKCTENTNGQFPRLYWFYSYNLFSFFKKHFNDIAEQANHLISSALFILKANSVK